MKIFDKIPFSMAVMFCLTLGLAPFVPQPHIVEKLALLFSGQLTNGVDIGDLLFHGAPWLILFGKFLRMSVLVK